MIKREFQLRHADFNVLKAFSKASKYRILYEQRAQTLETPCLLEKNVPLVPLSKSQQGSLRGLSGCRHRLRQLCGLLKKRRKQRKQSDSRLNLTWTYMWLFFS